MKYNGFAGNFAPNAGGGRRSILVGIASCIISRGEETFAGSEGKCLHCLHYEDCYELCPVRAVERRSGI